MGQQQLLLLVLGIVIVGLAVVVGIQAFGENQKKANADAMTNDAIRIASDAQAWNLKPAAFGGGNGDWHRGTATSGALVGLSDLGYEVTSGVYSNLNGDYEITASGTGILISGENTDRENGVRARVCGTGPNDITTTIGTDTMADPAACP